jgi:hippurate hydrolase
LFDLYSDLHRHPELSMQERRTASILAERLRELGYESATGVGGTGVVGVLQNGPGPVVMLRADMDGLPVQEETGLDYASRVRGVMHACGHDMHVAWLVGAAEDLAGRTDGWSGTVVLVGQPGEETGEGARAMVADGLHERFPRPDFLLGQHVGPGPVGYLDHTPGLMTSASDRVDVTIRGRGGHGSRPEAALDPVPVAAHVILRLQTLVAREIHPRDPVVITVGSIHAGTANNVIPDTAGLSISVRTQHPDTRRHVLEAIARVVRAECAASGLVEEPQIVTSPGFPMTVNDPDLVRRLAAVHRELPGVQEIVQTGPIMGSEDFSILAPPGCPTDYWLVAATPADQWEAAPGDDPEAKLRGVPANHSRLFAPDPAVLGLGAQTLASAVRRVLVTSE